MTKPIELPVMPELPTVARLYYTGLGARRYKRASTRSGPGEGLCFVSLATEYLRRQAALHAAALASQAAEMEALRRWKSTNSPRLDALQGLLTAAQHEAHAGREAVASLPSEREANALLTDEAEALRADAERIEIDGHSLAPANILKRVIRNLKPKRGRPMWAAVHEATAHGSTVSIGLCQWAGVDPDTGAALKEQTPPSQQKEPG